MPVLAHISGASGAGKSTLLDRLRDKHPELATVDLDAFDELAKEKLGNQLGIRPNDKGGVYVPDEAALFTLHQHRQKLLDAHLKKNKNRPIVLGGLHIEGPTEYKFDTANRYLLNTGPLKSAWRAYRRSHAMHREDSTFPRRRLRDIPAQWGIERREIKTIKGAGYSPMSAKEIERQIGQALLKAQSKASNPH